MLQGGMVIQIIPYGQGWGNLLVETWLNVFALIARLLMKVPALNPLAPTC
jgi:hypothetical protein